MYEIFREDAVDGNLQFLKGAFGNLREHIAVKGRAFERFRQLGKVAPRWTGAEHSAKHEAPNEVGWRKRKLDFDRPALCTVRAAQAPPHRVSAYWPPRASLAFGRSCLQPQLRHFEARHAFRV